MSRYVVRNVEGKFSLAAGYVNNKEKLPETAPEGTYYRVGNCDSNFMAFEGGKWIPKDSCPTEWRALHVYTKSKLPSESDWESPKRQTEEYLTHDQKLIYFFRHEDFCNNGGPIRDDYISTNGWSDGCDFNDRGLPSDATPETLRSLEYQGKREGWDYTWCTLEEWENLYEKEKTRILQAILDKQAKQFNKTTDKKLDFIIHNMKDPMGMNLKEIYPDKKDDDEGEFDEDAYYESPQCIIDDEFDKLWFIAAEYGRILQIADFYGKEYAPEDIRIIYHISG